MTAILSTLSFGKTPGCPLPPSIRRVFIGGFVFFLLFALAGCSRKPDQTSEVKRFVELTRSDFETLGNWLPPLLARKDNRRKVDETLMRFLSDADARAGRSNLGVAVLDGGMNYIAGRSLSAERPDVAPIQTSLSDFSYLEDLFRKAGEGIAHQPLYYRGREIFTICSAIRTGENPDAYVCLFYDAEAFRRAFGFGKKTFTEIDFSG